MAITVEQKCDRCRRMTKHAVENIQDAADLENLRQKREENAAKLEAFIKQMVPEELPALLVLRRVDGATPGVQLLTAATLCNFKEEGKRSCSARVAELAEAMGQLEERKKSVRKAKASEPTPIPLIEQVETK